MCQDGLYLNCTIKKLYISNLTCPLQKYNKLYEPIECMFNGQTHKIQFNYCVNPYCLWFGQPQERFEYIKNKPSRYKLSSKGRNRTDSIVCNSNHEPHPDKKSHNCNGTPVSNWGVAEVIKRLATVDIVKNIEPDYVFHKEGCVNEVTIKNIRI